MSTTFDLDSEIKKETNSYLANLRRRRKLIQQVDATLTIGGREFDLTLNHYGTRHPFIPGQSGGEGERQVSPDEPAHAETDAITLSDGNVEIEIDSALGEEVIGWMERMAMGEGE